jgi:hypothetical protein
MMLALVAAGFALWLAHATAWDLGRRSPVLSFDAAQYAVAARELAEQGRLATTFALPIELARHPQPPWPLAVVQPGLVIADGLIQRLVPPVISIGNQPLFALRTPHERAWLALLIPFGCYLLMAAFLALTVGRLLTRYAPDLPAPARVIAGGVVGLSYLLDPEAQHFATGGFTELPYTLGLVFALALLASGHATRRPFLFGLLIAVAGSFRANMLVTAPLLALGAAALAEPGRRVRTLAMALLGYVLLTSPWWIYKWRSFGSPGWDLSTLAIWDGAGSNTWFSLTHLPEAPVLPEGRTAVRLLAAKLGGNLLALLLPLTVGPRGLWIGALVVWLLASREPRPLRIVGWIIVAHAVITLFLAALGASWQRYLFPARVPLEAAGILALGALASRLPGDLLGRRGIALARVAVAVLALGWGAWQTTRGLEEARKAADRRALPRVNILRDLDHRLRRVLVPGETVMSNLGPTLAWYTHRPVLHVALTPAAIEACRARCSFRHVLLVFRDAERAWPGWDELMAHPEEATSRPEWNVANVQAWHMYEFQFVWLELGPPRAQFAGASETRRPGIREEPRP